MTTNKIHGDRIVSIPFNKLISMGITVEQYYFAYSLYEGQRWILDLYIKNVKLNYIAITDALMKLGLVEFISYGKDGPNYNLNNLQVTQEFYDLINENVDPKGAASWIDEWYALWPTGIKSGGYYLKTDKKGVLKKMQNFLIKYPDFDKDLIMKATESYLLDQALGGYAYTKLAPYFIEKDGLSVLAGECENIREHGLEPEIDMYGGDEL